MAGDLGGRPRLYEDSEEGLAALEAKIEEYRQYCLAGKKRKWVDKKGQLHEETLEIMPTKEGFAIFLDFSGRQGLKNYEDHPRFMDALARANSWMIDEKLQGAAYGQWDAKIVEMAVKSSEKAYRNQDSLELSLKDQNIPGRLNDAFARSAAAKAEDNK